MKSDELDEQFQKKVQKTKLDEIWNWKLFGDDSILVQSNMNPKSQVFNYVLFMYDINHQVL